MDSKQGKRETNRRGEIMLKAVFSRFGEEIELTDELWQYDFGQKIQVTGIELPDQHRQVPIKQKHQKKMQKQQQKLQKQRKRQQMQIRKRLRPLRQKQRLHR